ncbi:MAG: hypothetical protein JJW01_02235 [Alphaproteobacteria bacterium]|nr:hypothetical protein [Rickettsiales bacterium]
MIDKTKATCQWFCKNNTNNTLKIAITIVTLCGKIALIMPIAGCTKLIEGYRFKPEKSNFKIEEATVTTVTNKYGAPTIIEKNPDTNGKILIYGSESFFTFLFIRKHVLSRRLEIFEFDRSNVLIKADELTLEDGTRAKIRRIVVKVKKPNKLWALPFYSII